MLRLLPLFGWIVNIVLAFENWPDLSSVQDDAFRTERDVSNYIPLDQVGLFGVLLNQVVFEPYGYIRDSILLLQGVLNVRTGTLMLDMYWNEFTQKWQLCPAPFPDNLTANLTEPVDVWWNGKRHKCEPGLSPADLMATISLYLRSTNVNLDANIVRLMLRLKSIFYQPKTQGFANSTAPAPQPAVPSGYRAPSADFLNVGNLSLAQSVSGLGSFAFSPDDLAAFSESGVVGNYTNYYLSTYPTLYDFLFNLYKRTVVFVVSDDLRASDQSYNITKTDKSAIFFRDSSDMSLEAASNTEILDSCSARRTGAYDSWDYSDMVSESHFRVVVDDLHSAFSNSSLRMWAACGYSPILNASYPAYAPYIAVSGNGSRVGAIMNNYVLNQYWSWALGQPDATAENNTSSPNERRLVARKNTPYETLSNTQFADKCVAMTTDGWNVRNCYDQYRAACQNELNPFDWALLSNIATYFDMKDDDLCPENFTFSLPHLSMEQGALITYLNSRNVLSPVWIDLNDITITGCFVSGGPYAPCPYRRIVTARNLIRSIAPSLLVAFVIILLIFYSKFFHTIPVHTNRKRHWKRVINQYNKENDYEGVPS